MRSQRHICRFRHGYKHELGIININFSIQKVNTYSVNGQESGLFGIYRHRELKRLNISQCAGFKGLQILQELLAPDYIILIEGVIFFRECFPTFSYLYWINTGRRR